jgi:cytochrome c peroxidase
MYRNKIRATITRRLLAGLASIVKSGHAIIKTSAFVVLLVAAFGVAVHIVKAQEPAPAADAPPPPVSLKTIPIPGPPRAVFDEYVRDKEAAIQLGKALFWDTKVGSDNKTACATCHFHAGADNRTKNQLSPGLLANDKTFQSGGPNYTLKASDFPLTKHTDVNDAASRISDTNDVVSSQGVFTATFTDAGVSGAPDTCTAVSDAIGHGGSGFNLNGVNTRRAEPRNTPTVINSVFNFRNFWDGRANNMFNGAAPFGLRNPNLLVWKLESGVLRQIKLAIPTSALSSLASGPPLSENEMSCRNRTFTDVGRKLLDTAVLADQVISTRDSVLGSIAADRPTYASLVKKAFRPEYWRSPSIMIMPATFARLLGTMDLENSRHPNHPRTGQKDSEVTQMQANFAMFFGMAVQSYLATLVANDTPFDRYAEGDTSAMNAQQIRGFEIFRGPTAQCIHCHANGELTSASTKNLETDVRLDQRLGVIQQVFRYDNGFFNTGVRPTAEDPGVGGLDPFGYPLSETRMAQRGDTDLLGNGFHEAAIDPNALTAVDGAFKTPGLRNVEFTGPYFHNGGKSTLMQVVDFYNRGGDFGRENQPIPDPTIKSLGLTEEQKQDLVAFLLALSDERVAHQKAPFDHPSICVPDGHEGDQNSVKADESGNALDVMKCLPEVGARGTKGRLSTFLNLDPLQR